MKRKNPGSGPDKPTAAIPKNEKKKPARKKRCGANRGNRYTGVQQKKKNHKKGKKKKTAKKNKRNEMNNEKIPQPPSSRSNIDRERGTGEKKKKKKTSDAAAPKENQQEPNRKKLTNPKTKHVERGFGDDQKKKTRAFEWKK